MSEEWRDRLVLDEIGRPVKNLAINIFLMLQHHPDVAGIFTIRGDVSMLVRPPPYTPPGDWVPRSMERLDILRLKMWLQDCGFRPSSTQIKDAVRIILSRDC